MGAEVLLPDSLPSRKVFHIPKVLRSPVLAARMLLATVTGVAGTPFALDALNAALSPGARSAEAAAVCNPKNNNYQYTIVLRVAPFFDWGGKEGIFDKGVDPWIEVPVTGGGVKAIERSTGKILSESNFSLDRPNVPPSLFQPKTGEQNLAWSVLRWQGNCDTDTERKTPTGKSRITPGKEIKIVTTQDERNQSFDRITTAEGVDSVWTGRRYKTAKQFIEDVDKFPKQVRDLTSEDSEKIRKLAQAQPTPTATRTPAPSPIGGRTEDLNTKATETAGELDRLRRTATTVAQQGSPSATPTPTLIPTSTATSTETSTATSTAIPPTTTATASPIVNPPAPLRSEAPGLLEAGKVVIDSPARFVSPDLQPPWKWGVDLAGWLPLGLLLLNWPGHVRTRIHNTYMNPIRRWRGVVGPPGVWHP